MQSKMIQVSEKAFFATVGQLDVHPSLEGQAWDEIRGYKSVWKLRNGEVIGESEGNGDGDNDRYFVTGGFYEAHRATITKATNQVG